MAGKMIELLVDPIQRELGYFFCFNNNIQDLETALGQLKATRNDVQAREDAEQRSWKTLGETVKLWIENANGKIAEAENVIKDKAELQKGCFSIKWCPNLKLRFSLGGKGKKLSLVLKELLQRGGNLPSTGIDLPMPSINMNNYNGDACDFESRQKIMEEIIKMLGDKETKLIGICGMGGIGKTTFANQVLQKVNDFHKHLFDIQVNSTVSSNPNFNAIQQQVIERLRGPSLKEIGNEIERAERLRRAFDNKKVIVLLDDVWEEFDLNGKGFPLKQTDCCCKIIYTSRNKGLWAGERTVIGKKEISLDLLSRDEAWKLFIRKVDLHDDDDDNEKKKKIGRKIVDECDGLPLALEVAGGALIEKDTCNWEDMLFRLQREHQHHTEKVHKVLATSYGCLEDPIAKHIFLLCCLFPEDEQIPIERLYRYAMGLQLFKGMINDLYHIRNRCYTLVNDLITRNLLINVVKERLVKMHDVVRAVGLSIAKQEEKDIHSLIISDRHHGVNQLQNNVMMGPNTKMISIKNLKKHLKVPEDVMEFRGSKLELLRLDTSHLYRSNIEISRDLFQGRDDLKVLDIVGNDNDLRDAMITWFPHSSPFPYLSMLRMLSLEYMDLNNTSNLSFIQHLTCLEILSFCSSYHMGDLPNKVGELRNLKVLDLTDCPCFINDGILSRLTNLQELHMWDSFDDWKSLKEEDIEKNNNAAKLIELNCLYQLRRLELSVPNIQQLPRDGRLFSSSTLLKQFKISIGEFKISIGEGKERRRINENNFKLSERSLLVKNVEGGINLFNALQVLIENDITSLYLCNDSDMWEQMYLNRHLNALRSLNLHGLKSFNFPTKVEIPQLKYLEIKSLPSIINLDNIVAPLLQELKIDSCDNLKYIFSYNSLMMENISNLQNLTITQCRRLKGIIGILPNIEEQGESYIEFSKLIQLELGDLDKLVSFVIHINHLDSEEENEEKPPNALFYYDDDKVSISCLQELRLHKLSKINYIIGWKKGQGHHDDIEEGSPKEILQPFFPNLKSLAIGYLDQLLSFVGFINTIGHNSNKQNTLFYSDDDEVSFSCLEELTIEFLSKINYIVVRKGGRRQHHRNIEGGDCDQKIQPQLFPNLSNLTLSGLDQLESFTNYIDEKSEEQKALFYHEDDQVSFPSLKTLNIERLPKINYIVGCKKGRGEDNDIIEEEVQPPIFSILEDLYVTNLSNLIHIYPINHPEVGVFLFQNVNWLEISRCEKMRYLFSEKIGRVAANYLEILGIFDCPMMEVVMKNEEEEDNRGEREGIICLPNPNIHFFPLLWRLDLRNLSSLRRFCDIAYTWTLPSLKWVCELKDCPKLEALSPGSLESPKLVAFYYNSTRHSIEDNWKGDLNAALRDVRNYQEILCVEELDIRWYRD